MDTELLTPEELQEFYNSLPDDLQDAIFSPESMDTYNQIQERYALDPSQREELSIQTGLLMMGITEPKEYVLVLAEKLGIPRDKAAFIAQEVNRNILHGVRESLKEVHTVAQEEGVPLSQSTPAPVAVDTAPVIMPIPAPSIPPSTLNQKLGDAFRVQTPPQAPVPNYSAPAQEAPLPVTPPPQAPRANDPYRESPL